MAFHWDGAYRDGVMDERMRRICNNCGQIFGHHKSVGNACSNKEAAEIEGKRIGMKRMMESRDLKRREEKKVQPRLLDVEDIESLEDMRFQRSEILETSDMIGQREMKDEKFQYSETDIDNIFEEKKKPQVSLQDEILKETSKAVLKDIGEKIKHKTKLMPSEQYIWDVFNPTMSFGDFLKKYSDKSGKSREYNKKAVDEVRAWKMMPKRPLIKNPPKRVHSISIRSGESGFDEIVTHYSDGTWKTIESGNKTYIEKEAKKRLKELLK